MFVAQADIPPVIPIVAPESSVPGIKKEEAEDSPLSYRDDAERFENVDGFIDRVNTGVEELRKVICPGCSDEDWVIAGASLKGFIYQVMYKENTASELAQMKEKGESPKEISLENLEADLGLIRDNPELFSTLSSLTAESWGSYQAFAKTIQKALKNYDTRCLGDKDIYPLMESPARNAYVKMILGYKLSSKETKALLDSILVGPANSDGSPSSIFSYINKANFNFDYNADRFKWQRTVISRYVQILKAACTPLNRAQRVPSGYGKPQRNTIQLRY